MNVVPIRPFSKVRHDNRTFSTLLRLPKASNYYFSSLSQTVKLLVKWIFFPVFRRLFKPTGSVLLKLDKTKGREQNNSQLWREDVFIYCFFFSRFAHLVLSFKL